MEAAWHKASGSFANGNCVEVAGCTCGVRVRDSKLGEASPVLNVSRRAWGALLADIKAGALNLP